ncbi:tetratricopeptide repeat protein [Mesonia ostreae]|uniref:Tetratricopeptide repeat protein n=1 Tax=Mesonia ostreae TaxID=861110 RepID=A0ABU2KIG0_9FLAO|nr:tetratricopeptide repeat protein [Mesonia ostreae]MDT0294501.1 tetratricopeptide repeat protein [Mesonia ostreae]
MQIKHYYINVRGIQQGFVFILLLFSGIVSAQEENKKAQKQARSYSAQAQKSLAENDFAQAEANYRKAISKDPENAEAKYNLGNLYYAKDKEKESAPRLKQAGETSQSKALKHKAFHNQGNAYMKQKEYEPAVEAFKNALRNNPQDDQTRYNLALAKKMLEKQQQEQEQDQDKDKDQEDQDKKDQQNKDEKEDGDNKKEEGENKDKGDEGDQKDEQDKSDKEEEKDGDEKKEEQPKDPSEEKGDESKEQKPQQAQGQLSPQQIKNLLEAMENQEKEIQDKINAKKAKGKKVETEKDW